MVGLDEVAVVLCGHILSAFLVARRADYSKSPLPLVDLACPGEQEVDTFADQLGHRSRLRNCEGAQLFVLGFVELNLGPYHDHMIAGSYIMMAP